MGGGLRGPLRPFEVFCVLAAALCAVAFSISPNWAQVSRSTVHTGKNTAGAQTKGNAPVPDKPNLGSLGERINANTIAIVSGNLNATYLTIAYDLSAVL